MNTLDKQMYNHNLYFSNLYSV